MPYMRLSLTQKLTPEKRTELVTELDGCLELIPGKHGPMLILDIEDGKTMFVGPNQQDNFAFADMRYYSNFEYHIKKEFTKAVFKALNKVLGTTDDKMFLTIDEYNNWGGFGDFKDEYYDE
jgi:hypothetical protein